MLEMLRIHTGLTRVGLAEKAGIGRSRVGMIELGRATPGPESVELAKLASCLGLNDEPARLLDDVSERDETRALRAAREKGLR